MKKIHIRSSVPLSNGKKVFLCGRVDRKCEDSGGVSVAAAHAHMVREEYLCKKCLQEYEDMRSK